MEKKYQIFISSTYTDLIEERKAVQETILSMYQFPIGMEMFSADDDEQWEIIRETIDSSDYYVLIIAHKYGTISSDGISYTEKEYRYAKSKKIPILAFIIDNDVPVEPTKIEDDSFKKKKLNKFIEDVKDGRMVQWWRNKEELSNLVMNSLYKKFTSSKRTGWIRSDCIDIEKAQNELLELSKQVRILEKENRELKEQSYFSIPQVNVNIDGQNYISLDQYLGEISEVEKHLGQYTASWVYFIFENNGIRAAENVEILIEIPDEICCFERDNHNVKSNKISTLKMKCERLPYGKQELSGPYLIFSSVIGKYYLKCNIKCDEVENVTKLIQVDITRNHLS